MSARLSFTNAPLVPGCRSCRLCSKRSFLQCIGRWPAAFVTAVRQRRSGNAPKRGALALPTWASVTASFAALMRELALIVDCRPISAQQKAGSAGIHFRVLILVSGANGRISANLSHQDILYTTVCSITAFCAITLPRSFEKSKFGSKTKIHTMQRVSPKRLTVKQNR